jgi:hypothetical protein
MAPQRHRGHGENIKLQVDKSRKQTIKGLVGADLRVRPRKAPTSAYVIHVQTGSRLKNRLAVQRATIYRWLVTQWWSTSSAKISVVGQGSRIGYATPVSWGLLQKVFSVN